MKYELRFPSDSANVAGYCHCQLWSTCFRGKSVSFQSSPAT